VISEDLNNILLLQRNGTKKTKAKFIPLTPLTTNTAYDIKITYNAGLFELFLNDQSLGSMKSVAAPKSQEVYFQLRSTTSKQVTATLDSVLIY
jgi:hypothetical protein